MGRIKRVYHYVTRRHGTCRKPNQSSQPDQRGLDQDSTAFPSTHQHRFATSTLSEPIKAVTLSGGESLNQHDQSIAPSSSSHAVASQPDLPMLATAGTPLPLPDRSEKFGLFPMNQHALDLPSKPLSNEMIATEKPKYPVDIIAIHGITGDAYNTWKHRNGKLWLRDLLSEDLPGSRIYSYGYDAAVFFSFNTAGYDEYARTLLASIKRTRLSEESRQRPIIFICHSMGGIIVKQALISSVLSGGLYENIRTSCLGVIFMGTPHQGSKETGLPKIITAMLNIAMIGTSRLFGKARTDLISNLDREATSLDKISRDFIGQVPTLKIASCIEQNITFPANERIVDGISGIMKVPGEIIIDMQGSDHKSICRFSHRDSNYELLLGILLDWIDCQPARVVPHRDKSRPSLAQFATNHTDDLLITKSIRSLYFEGMDWRRWELDSGLGMNNRDVNRWFYTCEPYNTWLHCPQGMLWLKGKPGSGKSTIMKSLVDEFELRKSDECIVLSFFFHAFGGPDQRLRNSAAGMYRALLFQLLDQVPSSASRFCRIFERRRQLHTPYRRDRRESLWHDRDRNQLRSFLTSELENLESSIKVRLFVDAIDEAPQGTRQDVSKYLHDLDESLRRNGKDVRVCLSSRHFPLTPRPEVHSITLEKANEEAIVTFVKEEFHKSGLRSRQSLEADDDLTIIEDAIIQNASGMFIWVSLIVNDTIERLKNGELFERVHSRIAVPPLRLGAIYTDMLRNVIAKEDRAEAYSVLNWIINADEPVLLMTLASEVDTLRRYSSTEGLVHLKDAFGKFSGGLVEVLSHPVRVEESIVQFIHPTVRTFFREGGLQKQFEDQRHEDSMVIPTVQTSCSNDLVHISRRTLFGFSRRKESLRRGASLYRRAIRAHWKKVLQWTESMRLRMKDEELWAKSLRFAQRHDNFHEPPEPGHIKTDQWLDELFRNAKFYGKDPKDQRCVKVAILDSGIDVAHPYFEGRLTSVGSSFWPTNDPQSYLDVDGHGTYAASLIMRLAPAAKIYVAKVTKEDPSNQELNSSVAKAIDWAVGKGVNIVTIPIDFDVTDDKVALAIKNANAKNITVCSSKTGVPNALCIRATDGYGNCPARLGFYFSVSTGAFAILGDGVESAWPCLHGEGPTKRASGPAVATSMAAGLAAFLMSIVLADPSFFSDAESQFLLSPEGIRTMFRFMSVSRGPQRWQKAGNIVPQTLLTPSPEAYYRILKNLAAEHMAMIDVPLDEFPLSGQSNVDSKEESERAGGEYLSRETFRGEEAQKD